jgi:hypothetical protein
MAGKFSVSNSTFSASVLSASVTLNERDKSGLTHLTPTHHGEAKETLPRRAKVVGSGTPLASSMLPPNQLCGKFSVNAGSTSGALPIKVNRSVM